MQIYCQVFVGSIDMQYNSHMQDRHFINCCYGYQEYIGERLHTQKCLLGDTLHVYRFRAFIKKCTIVLVSRCTTVNIS